MCCVCVCVCVCVCKYVAYAGSLQIQPSFFGSLNRAKYKLLHQAPTFSDQMCFMHVFSQSCNIIHMNFTNGCLLLMGNQYSTNRNKVLVIQGTYLYITFCTSNNNDDAGDACKC